MPHFTREDVQRLARLARLELGATEIDLFTRQLANILDFARQVDGVDTTMIAAADVLAARPVTLRDDLVRPSIDRQEVLAAAPDADPAAGLFKVPRVINS